MILDRREYERLIKENEELRAKYEKLRFRVAPSAYFLDDFEYAVLLPKDSHTLRVWNQGRFEEKVISIEVGQEAGCMPYLKIEK